MPKIKVEIKYGDNIGLLTPRGIELCLEEFFKKEMFKFKVKEVKSVGLDERKIKKVINGWKKCIATNKPSAMDYEMLTKALKQA